LFVEIKIHSLAEQ